MNTRAITQNKKVVTFGEVMLRLTAPNFQRFSQTNEFIATYGGSEANVAISLVNFGIPTEFVTRLPENAMAQACVNSLQTALFMVGNAWDYTFWKAVQHFVTPM